MTYLEKIAKAEGLEFDDRALRYISKAAHGGMRDAVNLMERVIAFADDVSEASVRTTLGILPEEVVKKFISAFSSGDPSQILKMSEDIQSGGFTYEVFLEQVIDAVKEQLVCETSGANLKLLSSLWEINRELRYAEDKRGTFEVMTLLKSGLGKVRSDLIPADETTSTDSIAVEAYSNKSEDSEIGDGKELTKILEHLRRNDFILLWTLLSLANIRSTKDGKDFVVDTDSDYSHVLLEERLESLNLISMDLVGKRFFLADDSVREDPLGSLDEDSREYVDAVIAGLGLKDDLDKGKIKIELEED
jgi:DNA polymerase-3 subunit gamma/tau